MVSIVAALAQSLLFRVEDRIEETVQRSKRNAIFALLAGLLLLTAYTLAVAGLTVALAQRHGAIAALFGLAGGATLLAVILVCILVYLNKREAKIRRRRRQELRARGQLAALAAGSAARNPLATAALGVALALFLKPSSRRRRHNDD